MGVGISGELWTARRVPDAVHISAEFGKDSFLSSLFVSHFNWAASRGNFELRAEFRITAIFRPTFCRGLSLFRAEFDLFFRLFATTGLSLLRWRSASRGNFGRRVEFPMRSIFRQTSTEFDLFVRLFVADVPRRRSPGAHGPQHMGPSTWAPAHGAQHMGPSTWAPAHGPQHMGPSTWAPARPAPLAPV